MTRLLNPLRPVGEDETDARWLSTCRGMREEHKEFRQAPVIVVHIRGCWQRRQYVPAPPQKNDMWTNSAAAISLVHRPNQCASLCEIPSCSLRSALLHDSGTPQVAHMMATICKWPKRCRGHATSTPRGDLTARKCHSAMAHVFSWSFALSPSSND